MFIKKIKKAGWLVCCAIEGLKSCFFFRTDGLGSNSVSALVRELNMQTSASLPLPSRTHFLD